MPWVPELFSAPVLQRFLDKQRRDTIVDVPFFDGLVAGETDALVGSFAGEPEVHHPVRGRIKGVKAFTAFVAEMSAWFAEHNVEVEDVERVVLRARGFEEVLLRVDGDGGRVEVPFALVADHPAGERIEELRLYWSTEPLTGRHTGRPPLLQPDPDLHPADVVGEYQRALAAGDLDAVVATFEPDGYARAPTRRRVPRHGRPARLLRAALLQRRRHPARALRGRRRRPRVRAGVQRRAVGPDRAAAAAGRRRLRPGRQREARRGPDLRRRRPAAPAP